VPPPSAGTGSGATPGAAGNVASGGSATSESGSASVSGGSIGAGGATGGASDGGADLCSPNPCLNSGACKIEQVCPLCPNCSCFDRASCECQPGFSGMRCEVAPASPSCEGLAKNCGASANDDCCSSLPVPGGSFFRGYDGVTDGDTSEAYPATVTNFRLDRYEVTVGRFRKFIRAWNTGWRPAIGAGKHAHLNGGQGLTDSARTTTYELGWDSSFTSSVSLADVDLSCGGGAGPVTWTPTVGSNENRPMNCVNWYEAFAFCIWDGGFLPSEEEWNYAASGGSDQRVYPWSTPANSTTIDCSYANFGGANFPTSACVAPGTGTSNNVGSESPNGDGRYGQTDLAGNVWERVWAASTTVPPGSHRGPRCRRDRRREGPRLDVHQTE